MWRGCRERLRVKEEVVRDSGCCSTLRVGWGNLPEAGKTVGPGSRSGAWWGQGKQEPYCAGGAQRGPETGWSQLRGMCVCEALGRRPRDVKGSESSWLAGSAPPTPGPGSGRLGVEGSAQPENW